MLDEGTELTAYPDTNGYWTIGVGRCIDKNPLTKEEQVYVLQRARISNEAAMFLLRNDILNKQQELYGALPWIENISEPRQRALMNMAFQMGVTGLLKFVPTLALMKAGRWEEAVERLKTKTLWGKTFKNRAARVCALLLTEA